MKVAIGADHGGFELKQALIQRLTANSCELMDLGTHSSAPVDYPDIAVLVAQAVVSHTADFGIIIDGAGIGSAMAANKIIGVRAATANELFTARNSRLHNNANVLCLGSRVIGPGVAEEIVKIFLSTAFEGGRHQSRVDKIMALEAPRAAERFGLEAKALPAVTADVIRTIVMTVLRDLRLTLPATPNQQQTAAPTRPTSSRHAITERVVTESLVRALHKSGATQFDLAPGALVTPLAKDYLTHQHLEFRYTQT